MPLALLRDGRCATTAQGWCAGAGGSWAVGGRARAHRRGGGGRVSVHQAPAGSESPAASACTGALSARRRPTASVRASHGPRSDFAADHARSALIAAWRLRSAVARRPHAAAHASCGRCGASHARVRGCAVVARARVVLARVEDDGRPRLPLPRGVPGRPVAAPRGPAVRHIANDRRRGLTGVDYSSTRGLDRAGSVPAAGCVPPQWSVVAGGGRATWRCTASEELLLSARPNPRRSRIRPGTSRPSPMRCSTTSFRR